MQGAEGVGCGGWIRTTDLRVMSPTSCHCSTPPAKYRQRGANRQMRRLFPVDNGESGSLPINDAADKIRNIGTTRRAQR